jgi:hypothetical protein
MTAHSTITRPNLALLDADQGMAIRNTEANISSRFRNFKLWGGL